MRIDDRCVDDERVGHFQRFEIGFQRMANQNGLRFNDMLELFLNLREGSRYRIEHVLRDTGVWC